MRRFYLRQLTLRNVKSISHTRLSFAERSEDAPGWYVLAGRNGSCKSTLLQSLALAAMQDGNSALMDSSMIRLGEPSGSAQVLLLGEPGDQDLEQEWRISRRPVLIHFAVTSGTRELSGGSFLAAYGPFKRLEGGSDLARKLAARDPTTSQTITLFLEEASLWEVSKWLFRLGYESEREGFQSTLLSFLNSGLLPDGFRVEKIVDDDLLLSTPGGAEIPLRRISDGPRCMIAMILDVIRGLEVCHGRIDFDDGRITNPGLVLIDEPDNHLHLSWQLRLGSWLKDRFPRIQWIVATHSPFVCVAADKIWRLDDENGKIAPRALSAEELRLVRNGSITAILESDAFRIFSTVPPEARERHHDYLELRRLSLQGKRLSPEEKQRLFELEQEFLGPSVPPDPEFDALIS